MGPRRFCETKYPKGWAGAGWRLIYDSYVSAFFFRVPHFFDACCGWRPTLYWNLRRLSTVFIHFPQITRLSHNFFISIIIVPSKHQHVQPKRCESPSPCFLQCSFCRIPSPIFLFRQEAHGFHCKYDDQHRGNQSRSCCCCSEHAIVKSK